MGLQFSISGRCNVSFEEVESAASRKAAVDIRKVKLYTYIYYSYIRAFTTKLQLWEGQLESGNYAHFPTLKEYKPKSNTPFVFVIQHSRTEFLSALVTFVLWKMISNCSILPLMYR